MLSFTYFFKILFPFWSMCMRLSLCGHAHMFIQLPKEARRGTRIVGNRTPRPYKPPNIGAGNHTCFLCKSSKLSPLQSPYCTVRSQGLQRVTSRCYPVTFFPLESTQVASAHSERLLGLGNSSHTYTQSAHFLSIHSCAEWHLWTSSSLYTWGNWVLEE